MNSRIAFGGVVTGVVLFIWGFMSHMVLGIGDMGVSSMPNEDPVVVAMSNHVPDSGFYFFPGYEETPGLSQQEQQTAMEQWETKLRAGPRGVLIYHPTGVAVMSMKQLGLQLVCDVAAALIAAFLLSRAFGGLPGFGGRVLFIALLGLLAAFVVDIPYWNWYGFPADYTGGRILNHVLGWLLAGIVLAIILRPSSQPAVNPQPVPAGE